jgi:hypothetical protein
MNAPIFAECHGLKFDSGGRPDKQWVDVAPMMNKRKGIVVNKSFRTNFLSALNGKHYCRSYIQVR